MAKRSNFERKARDFYETPYSAVEPLLPFLPARSRYVEPCAGNMALVNHLQSAGHACHFMCDFDPQDGRIKKMNALDLTVLQTHGADFIITNPPWRREMLHPMIRHFTKLAPTFLLFDADWAHTAQAAPYLKYCSMIIAVGRVKWIEDSENTGKDNACWYAFKENNSETRFFGKTEKKKCEKTKELFCA